MLKWSIAFAFVLLPLSTAQGTSGAARVDYELAPTMAGDELREFMVSVRFPANASGTTGFGWLSSWRGDTHLSRYVRDFMVDGATHVTQDAPGHWRIDAVGGKPLTVRYRIVAGADPDPNPGRFDRSAPVIHGNVFSALGMVVFGRPDGSDKSPATFLWQAGPAQVPLVSDLQHLPAPGQSSAPPGTTEDILMSTLVGGAGMTGATTVANESEPRVGMLPGSVARPEEFVASVRRIVAAERSFWNERNPGPYTVTATPVPSSYNGFISGAGFDDSFALWVNTHSNNSDLTFFIAHEDFHSWNPGLLGKPYADPGSEQRAAWFNEGFTDYFGQALSLRSGAVTVEAFRDIWNSALLEYANSPWRNTPNATLAPAFFKDQDAKRMPYLRGAMLAARWNAKLRQQGADAHTAPVELRAVLLDQRRMASTSTVEPPALFVTAAARHGLDVKDDLARFIEKGETLTLASDTFGPCARVVTQQRPGYDTGYTSEDHRVTTVKPGGNAYLAGLRAGMVIEKKVSGTSGDSLKPLELAVLEGTTGRTIAFLPQGPGQITVQQLQLTSPAPADCASSLTGIRQLP